MPLPHRMLSTDPETMTGECAVCGPVRVRSRSTGPGKPRSLRCAVAVAQHRGDRHGYLRGEHGLTGREAKAFREGKPCEVCGTTEDEQGKALNVDHCHTTGTLRGVLCKRCNLGMAFLDDPEWLARALAYRDRDRTASSPPPG